MVLTAAAIHMVVGFAAFAHSFSAGMARFDAGGPERGTLEVLSSGLTDILWQPFLGLWEVAFSGRPGHRALQWLGLLANSVLWGLAVGGLVSLGTRKR